MYRATILLRYGLLGLLPGDDGQGSVQGCDEDVTDHAITCGQARLGHVRIVPDRTLAIGLNLWWRND